MAERVIDSVEAVTVNGDRGVILLIEEVIDAGQSGNPHTKIGGLSRLQ